MRGSLVGDMRQTRVGDMVQSVFFHLQSPRIVFFYLHVFNEFTAFLQIF